LLKPELFEKVGIEPPKGVLLYGPPGTGKTLLAKAVAHETNSAFIKLIGSELVRKYIGEGARLVRELFKLAEEKAPSILFIDEVDAIGAKRMESATSGDREVQRTLMQLLAEMDGFNVRGDVRIIAATNRPDIIDPAMLRPGRFDRLIEVQLPDYVGRKEIFKIHTRKMNLSKDVDINELANKTEVASGADIKSICMEAGMFTIRDGREEITFKDFENAIDKVLGKFEEGKREVGVMYG
ncbi:MAG: AAA family ATPase, partial [Candidatus Hydrothermarchaeales archaeon]